MNSNPLVSVIMSVYKPNRKLFPLALNSILGQTFTNFEFIIVDDGNSKTDSQYIRDMCRDSRVQIYKNHQNQGLTKSLNIAFFIARGIYIARQDADDVSFPTRFEKQISFFEKRPDIGLLGTNYELKKDDGEVLDYSVSSKSILIQLMYKNPFCHSSVMFRRESVAICGGYNEAYIRSQDFELWLRLIRITGAAIIEDILVMRHQYRGVALSTTSAAFSQFFNGVKLRFKYIFEEKRFELVPYFVVGTIYHLFNVIRNAISIK